ncbi:MAG: c-type cytochrome biogenesis protein CcsB [Nitrospiraceae bacterium]|nr:c-type cytochrome biogenesis protein CcsB [Nitrospiraceae bacterium]
MNSSQFFGISTIAYMVAMAIYITYIAFKKKGIGVTATTVATIGFACQTIAIILRGVQLHQVMGAGSSLLRALPITNLYESLIFFVWCLMLGYLIIERRYQNRSFGAFVTPIAALALLFIEISGASNPGFKEIEPLVPALQSNWLLAHVTLSFISYSMFALSFSTGLMYLIVSTHKNEPAYVFWTVGLGIIITVLAAMGIDWFRYKELGLTSENFVKSYLFRSTFRSDSGAVQVFSVLLAAIVISGVWYFGSGLKKVIEGFGLSAATLDEITYKGIAIGFPIFTLGGLIFGAIWADQAWGVYWSWDPKEVWSLITWLVYAFYLHARLLRGWRGHKIAVVSVMGFVSVICTYLVVNLLLSGLHSYGNGQ